MDTTTLKVKIKSLAAEARIIRREERKSKNILVKQSNIWRFEELQELSDKATAKVVWKTGRRVDDDYTLATNIDKHAKLRNHRVVNVRNASRQSQLVYAFLRGREYLDTEVPSKNPLTQEQIEEMYEEIRRFSSWETNSSFHEFMKWLPYNLYWVQIEEIKYKQYGQ